jgi:hypothetical protein
MPRFSGDRADAVMESSPQTTTLRGAWLAGAHIAWITVVLLALGFAIGGFWVGFQRPELISPPSIRTALDQEGISQEVAILIGLVLPWIAFTATGLFIFWRRSDDGAAMLFALLLVVWGGTGLRALDALERAHPGLWPPVRLLSLTVVFLLMVVLLVFPDGRFVPAWTRLLAAAAVPLLALFTDLSKTLNALPDLPEGISRGRFALQVLVASVYLGTGLWAQIYRYRHVSGPTQRQQTRWVVFSLGLLVVVLFVGFIIPSLFVDTGNSWFAWTLLATAPLFIAFPVSVATAILRYRLYDIDRIISRTIVYGALTALLAGVYAGAVLVLGQLFGGIGGEPPSWAIAGVTLGVAALFQPARRRIQSTVDRRFNRRRYDAAKTIEAFATRLREQLDLDALSTELLGVVDQTMQPTKASVWLRRPTDVPENRGDAVAHRLTVRRTGVARSDRRLS